VRVAVGVAATVEVGVGVRLGIGVVAGLKMVAVAVGAGLEPSVLSAKETVAQMPALIEPTSAGTFPGKPNGLVP
jgi:hypothetical protein